MNTNQDVSKALDRRRFLLSTLGAASAGILWRGLLTPARAQDTATGAPPGPSSAGRRIKIGLLGCGGRGRWIGDLFRKHGSYEVWAVADYFQPVADAAGEALGVDRSRRFSTLSGYKRVIESGVEAVVLETPPFFFPEHAKAAVEAGLHVYMAKPVAVDVPGCLGISAAAERARKNKRVFLVDYQMPTDPENQRVAQLIQAGEIGEVVALNSQYFASSFADPPLTATPESRLQRLVWVNDVALGGSYHVNACIHAVDAALWIAGQRPVSAMGYSRIARPDPHGDSDDVFELVFEFPNGMLLSHRGKHLDNLTGFDVFCGAQGRKGFAQLGYGGRAMLKGPENRHDAEVKNLYQAGAARNVARFHQAVTAADFTNETVARSVDGALTTILGREAGLRRAKLTLQQVLAENRRQEVDLSGLKS